MCSRDKGKIVSEDVFGSSVAYPFSLLSPFLEKNSSPSLIFSFYQCGLGKKGMNKRLKKKKEKAK